MARISSDQVRGLPDIMSTDNWEFIIGTIPGGSTDRQMVIKCQQVSYPGIGNEMFEVMLHGFTRRFRGKRTTPGTLSVTYVEDRTMDTTKQIAAWFEFIAGSASGTSGGYKRDYSVTGPQLITYDTAGVQIDAVTFVGLQPQDKPDVQYDGGSSQLYTISVTFAYDTYTSSNISQR